MLPISNGTSCHELVHWPHAVLGVVSSFRDLYTATGVPALCYMENIDVSNRIVSCRIVLGIVHPWVDEDDQDASDKSSDEIPRRGPKISTTDELGKAKRLMHTCFHIISGAVEVAKSRTIGGNILV